jgi:Protein of unknown function (DUF3365)
MNIEPRQRLWPMTLWITSLIVTVCAALVFGVHTRNAGQKNAARLIARQELLAHHWLKLEPDKDFRPVISAISGFSEALPNDVGTNWSVRFISASGQPTIGLDSFETEAVRQLENGTDEVWQESWLGVRRYMHAIRAQATCISCHPTAGFSGKYNRPGDVIGFISIDFTVSPDRSGSLAMNTSSH